MRMLNQHESDRTMQLLDQLGESNLPDESFTISPGTAQIFDCKSADLPYQFEHQR
jgi:hypothetical protein